MILILDGEEENPFAVSETKVALFSLTSGRGPG